MVNSYTPTYYSSLHDSITSLCKTILPFSFKNRRLAAEDHKLAKLQSDNLKWQHDSFHQIMNLMGLHKEGILSEHEVSAFRSHLLETLIASPVDLEQPLILRDKLLFLQELLYAKCISEDEYHCSKRPLLQRLAVQGAEIESRDVLVGGIKESKLNGDEEVWSEIDLKDENCLIKKENLNKSKYVSTMKQIKEATSVFRKNRETKTIFQSNSNPKSQSIGAKESSSDYFKENPYWNNNNLKEIKSESPSILPLVNLPPAPVKEKRKPFRTLFQGDGAGGDRSTNSEKNVQKSGKKQWGFEGLKKWKRKDSEEDETAPLPLNGNFDSESYNGFLVESPVGEGPNTKEIKKKIHPHGSSSDFFVDKVLGERIKKELSRIQIWNSNSNLQISDEQIEAISTRLPVDKADLKKFFPKSWCDQFGDVVINIVRKEFKQHVTEMESLRKKGNSMKWTTFEDEENCHPNLFAPKVDENQIKSESDFHYQNPFWSPSHC